MKKEKKGVQLILNILLIGLAASLVIIGLYAVSQIRRTSKPYSYENSEQSYYWDLSQGRYGDLLTLTNEDTLDGTVYPGSIREYQAVAKYYEAALLCRAYRNGGEIEEVSRQLSRMERFAEQAGSLSDEIVKINQMLGLG